MRCVRPGVRPASSSWTRKLESLPTAWTDAAVPDVIVAIGAGGSPFRCEDLLRLAAVIGQVHRSVVDEPGVKANSGRQCKTNDAESRGK